MTEKDNREGKRMKALDGQMICDIEYTTYKHLSNSWAYTVYIMVADDYTSKYPTREILIDGKRFVSIAGDTHFDTRSEAVTAAMHKLSELTDIIRPKK